jgi:hypothetical protein
MEKNNLLNIFSGFLEKNRFDQHDRTGKYLLDNFPGEYKGNVEKQFLNMGQLIKSGQINIDQDLNNKLTITTQSAFKEALSNTFTLNELLPFFNEKKQTVTLDDGIVEERVAFERYVDDDYGFFNKWLRGLSSTCTAYQLKFRDGILFSIRVQQYNTSTPDKLNYFLEISNIKKIIEVFDDTHENKKIEKTPAKITDWEF